jgi:hypothetical protein
MYPEWDTDQSFDGVYAYVQSVQNNQNPLFPQGLNARQRYRYRQKFATDFRISPELVPGLHLNPSVNGQFYDLVYRPALNNNPNLWRVELICVRPTMATDISETILDKARTGIYSPSEVKRGLDQHYLHKYFHQQAKDGYQIHPSIRSMVNFLPHNLVGTWPFYPKFDLIMLRNVLIYFNQEAKNKVLEKMHKQLNGDQGVLILGASESIYANELYKTVPLEKISYYQTT